LSLCAELLNCGTVQWLGFRFAEWRPVHRTQYLRLPKRMDWTGKEIMSRYVVLLQINAFLDLV